MAKSPKEYFRLTRDTAGLGMYSSLWGSADHLIIVRSTGYSEIYARLHLGDVQAIFLTRTARRMGWGIFWGAITAGAALALRLVLVTHQTPIFFIIFTGMGVVGLIWNHWLGPGCRAYVVTGVQTVELPYLGRMKKARRVVARLQPLIAAAQAHLAVPAVPAAEPPRVEPPPPEPPPSPAAVA
jgi:hypothetical protein